jgi:3-oxoadipate CoA-transferase beta subunit
MMRGGHLDFCVLGAFQVSVKGDLANWHTGGKDDIPAVGGAMDLAIGAKRVVVMMEHSRSGREQDRAACTYPVTGLRLRQPHLHRPAVIDVTPQGWSSSRSRRASRSRSWPG